ncbi:hypothetical protein CVT24_007218 [Panaeolus cyanescens]|uniref:ENTH domain-containing protein n=1 Tax=Panaeolus cyanescens TaxID=181874 RepID=A0A409VJD0_9AGAR|nr:hypothetical protein CVT24_007218 [Panaeolus cyanescens]
MDRLESLTNTLANITMYDIKSMYNQAKNVVLNVSEMEAKVREATNDDPWGASSTLMQEIAQGTFHFQYFNEIMPSIYSRFMEKEANQWRQIYKALQLLEYLVKHGSERVVDDARSHISTLKMLRNFHYIDEKGKDEGINVRNRSRELVELLSDVEKIRSERRKAKANKNKYVGVGSDGMSFDSGGGRFGGFGSDSHGSGSYGGSSGYTNDHYSSSSSNRYGGSSSYSGNNGGGRSSFGDSSRRQYEEYNAGDDEISHSSTPARSSSTRTPVRKSTAPTPTAAAPAPAPAPQPVADLLGGLDDDFSSPAPPPASSSNFATNKALPAVSNPVSLDDDDFADFQAAPIQTAAPVPASAPAPAAAAGKKPNLMDLLSAQPAAPPAYAQPAQPAAMGYGMGTPMGAANTTMGGHRQTPSMSSAPQFGGMGFTQSPPIQPQQPGQNLFGATSPPMRPTMGTFSPTPMQAAKSPVMGGTQPQPAKSSGNFDDLWSLSLGSIAKPATPANAGKSIKDLEKEKANAGLWGGQQKPSAGMASSPFGNFGNAAPASSSSGGDDLLL